MSEVPLYSRPIKGPPVGGRRLMNEVALSRGTSLITNPCKCTGAPHSSLHFNHNERF
jgi:hypothetical protein